MGGIPLPPTADVVLSAISHHAAGNPLDLHRLVHSLSRPTADILSPLLTALTHLTTRLHSTPETALPLRLLIDAVLKLDISTLVDPHATHHPCLTHYTTFLTNLISVDAAYVDPVLNLLVTHFFSPSPALEDVLAHAAHSILSLTLATHPRASALLADVVRRRFPHPVRPALEHVSFLRAVLRAARSLANPQFIRAVLTTALERLAAIEALVPTNVQSLESQRMHADSDADESCSLVASADKLQLAMLEVLKHVDACSTDPLYRSNTFTPLLSAYEAFIVPVQRTRFTPYLIIYAASLLNDTGVRDVAEKLRASFFDATMPDRLRENFLEHSAAMVMRASLLSSKDAQRWMGRVSTWLNSYVDSCERTGAMLTVDTDVHKLFYLACAVLMSVMTRRRDAIRVEAVARMRLLRVMGSSLSPLSVVPRDVVDEFVTVVEQMGGAHLGDIMSDGQGAFAPTRTKFGGRNLFSYSLRCPDLELPEVRDHVDRFARWDDSDNGERQLKRLKTASHADMEKKTLSVRPKVLAENVDVSVSS